MARTWSLKNILTKSQTPQTTTFHKYQTDTQMGKEYLIPYRIHGFINILQSAKWTLPQSLLLLRAILIVYSHLLGDKIMRKQLYRNKRQHNSNSTRRHIHIHEPVTFISASIWNSKILSLFTGQIICLLESVLKSHGIRTNARNYFNENLHLSKSESDMAN